MLTLQSRVSVFNLLIPVRPTFLLITRFPSLIASWMAQIASVGKSPSLLYLVWLISKQDVIKSHLGGVLRVPTWLFYFPKMYLDSIASDVKEGTWSLHEVKWLPAPLARKESARPGSLELLRQAPFLWGTRGDHLKLQCLLGLQMPLYLDSSVLKY